MITHFIIMSSSYSLGTRIALDYCLKQENSQEAFLEEIKKTMEQIKQCCGDDVSISTHSFQTEDSSWESVIKNDAFFEDVKIIENMDEFIKLIKQDRDLRGVDVAKYILSKLACTHLKLEKLVYLCYAEYLCKTGKKLFKDPIYAFDYGPVVESVYERYKGQRETLSETEEQYIDAKKISEMPAKSRILFAENGLQKNSMIMKTLEKYGRYSARELVHLTHKQNTPWNKTYDNSLFKPITDEVILKWHPYEEV